jgi:hypothetical protein
MESSLPVHPTPNKRHQFCAKARKTGCAALHRIAIFSDEVKLFIFSEGAVSGILSRESKRTTCSGRTEI